MHTGFQISIHVPAWGTTNQDELFAVSKIKFQSTFPRGERRGAVVVLNVLKQFQSTFPRGERPLWFCRECDSMQISIHVPAWGTTPQNCAFSRFTKFQSTFPRGERPQKRINFLYLFTHFCTNQHFMLYKFKKLYSFHYFFIFFWVRNLKHFMIAYASHLSYIINIPSGSYELFTP